MLLKHFDDLASLLVDPDAVLEMEAFFFDERVVAVQEEVHVLFEGFEV